MVAGGGVENAPPPCYFTVMAKPQPRPDVDPPLSPEEQAKYAALKADIDEGIRELNAGKGLDGKAVLTEIRARFGLGISNP